MATAAQEVTDQLQTDGHGTKGTDLFRGGERPADDDIPVNCSFCVPGAASLAPEAVSGDMGAVAYGSVQVLIRNHVYNDGISKALAIYRSLANAGVISGTIGHFMEQGYPVYLGEDSQRVYRFAINLTLVQLPDAFIVVHYFPPPFLLLALDD